MQLIDEEAANNHIHVRHFKIKRSIKSRCRTFELQCRYCSAVLRFRQQNDGSLLTTTVRNRHPHGAHPIQARSTITRWYLREADFRFPLGVSAATMFRTAKELQSHLEAEASQRNLPPNLYFVHNNGKNLSMCCRICRVRIRLLKTEAGLEVRSLDNFHQHDENALESYRVASDAANRRGTRSKQNTDSESTSIRQPELQTKAGLSEHNVGLSPESLNEHEEVGNERVVRLVQHHSRPNDNCEEEQPTKPRLE